MVEKDLLKRLPPEIRIQIYHLLLITPAPIIVVYTRGDVFLEDESPNDRKDSAGRTCTWDNRSLSILFTCRLYRLEAFPVLLSGNQLAHVAPWRPFDDQACTLSRLKVPKNYLHHIKYITFMNQEDIDDVEYEVQGAVVAMVFLILLFEMKTRLDQLVICLDSTKIGGKAMGHVHFGPLSRECHGASSLIPLAVKYFASNQVKRVYIGCHTRNAPQKELDSFEGRVWQLEKHIHDIFDEYRVRNSSRNLFAVFQASTNFYFSPVTRAFDLIFEKVTNGESLSSIDVSQTLAKNAKIKSGIWQGNALVLDNDNFTSWPDTFTVCLKELEARPPRPFWHSFHPIEGYYELEVDLSPWEWDKLKDVERWWASWWAAHQPGQRKITDYFRAERNVSERK